MYLLELFISSTVSLCVLIILWSLISVYNPRIQCIFMFSVPEVYGRAERLTQVCIHWGLGPGCGGRGEEYGPEASIGGHTTADHWR